MVPFVAVQVAETFVDAVVLYFRHGFAEDGGDSSGHGGVEHEVAGKYVYVVVFHDFPHLEDRVSAVQAGRLRLWGERHDASVVAAQDADRLAVESGMESFLDGAEETVAVYQCDHSLALCMM